MSVCESQRQKESALGISKILWLLLVTKTDTEENIYTALKDIGNNHDKIISLGSLYFHKMKNALTDAEIEILIKHYHCSENFETLNDWSDSFILKELH